jgi:tetratricopeptide (TPR) repeat protein
MKGRSGRKGRPGSAPAGARPNETPAAAPAAVPAPTWASPGLRIGIIFAAALAAYFPALRAGFVWNDRDYVTRPALRALGGLRLIWFKLGATEQYYPLLHSAFWAEHRLWGDSPLGYHLLNVLLHATSACLLGLILRRLAVPGAWLAAMIFTLHPVCAESVAWISEEKNTFSTLFYLLAAWAYLRFDERRRPRDYALGCCLFLCALLCKTVAATLPAALLVVFWWRRGRLEWKRDWLPILPWFGLGAAAGLFSAWVERTYIGASGSDFALSGLERVLLAGRVVWFYLGKLLWPANLIFIYPRWQVSASAPGQYLYPLAAGALTAGLWHWRRPGRGLLAGWLIFVGSLFPTLGFFNVYAFVFSYVADHWQYLASIGVFGLVGAGAARLLAWVPESGRLALRAAIGAVLGLLGFLTWSECRNYHDMQSFYGAILAKNPAAWLAHNNLGFELQGEGRRSEALAHYQEAIRLHPDYTEAHNNLGAALFEAGRIGEAIAEEKIALRLLPSYAEAHNNLGASLLQAGRPAEAIGEFAEASRLKPDYVEPVFGLGSAYYAARRYPEAIASFERALRLQPVYPEAENNLAVALVAAGRVVEAVPHYEAALRARPDYGEAQRNFGIALCDLDRPEQGLGHLETAVRLAPEDAQAQNSLGVAYYLLNRVAAAIPRFRSALRLDPAYPEAHNNLGLALSLSGQTAGAIAEYREAIRLKPEFPEAFYNLGNALEQTDGWRDGIAAFREAVRLRPGYAQALNNLGASLCRAGRTDEAAGEFALAVQADDHLADAHDNLGMLLEAQHRLPEALAQFAAAVRDRPDFAQAQLNYGQALQALGRSAEARIHLDRAAQLQAGAAGKP